MGIGWEETVSNVEVEHPERRDPAAWHRGTRVEGARRERLRRPRLHLAFFLLNNIAVLRHLVLSAHEAPWSIQKPRFRASCTRQLSPRVCGAFVPVSHFGIVFGPFLRLHDADADDLVARNP